MITRSQKRQALQRRNQKRKSSESLRHNSDANKLESPVFNIHIHVHSPSHVNSKSRLSKIQPRLHVHLSNEVKSLLSQKSIKNKVSPNARKKKSKLNKVRPKNNQRIKKKGKQLPLSKEFSETSFDSFNPIYTSSQKSINSNDSIIRKKNKNEKDSSGSSLEFSNSHADEVMSCGEYTLKKENISNESDHPSDLYAINKILTEDKKSDESGIKEVPISMECAVSKYQSFSTKESSKYGQVNNGALNNSLKNYQEAFKLKKAVVLLTDIFCQKNKINTFKRNENIEMKEKENLENLKQKFEKDISEVQTPVMNVLLDVKNNENTSKIYLKSNGFDESHEQNYPFETSNKNSDCEYHANHDEFNLFDLTTDNEIEYGRNNLCNVEFESKECLQEKKNTINSQIVVKRGSEMEHLDVMDKEGNNVLIKSQKSEVADETINEFEKYKSIKKVVLDETALSIVDKLNFSEIKKVLKTNESKNQIYVSFKKSEPSSTELRAETSATEKKVVDLSTDNESTVINDSIHSIKMKATASLTLESAEKTEINEPNVITNKGSPRFENEGKKQGFESDEVQSGCEIESIKEIPKKQPKKSPVKDIKIASRKNKSRRYTKEIISSTDSDNCEVIENAFVNTQMENVRRKKSSEMSENNANYESSHIIKKLMSPSTRFSPPVEESVSCQQGRKYFFSPNQINTQLVNEEKTMAENVDGIRKIKHKICFSDESLRDETTSEIDLTNNSLDDKTQCDSGESSSLSFTSEKTQLINDTQSLGFKNRTERNDPMIEGNGIADSEDSLFFSENGPIIKSARPSKATEESDTSSGEEVFNKKIKSKIEHKRKCRVKKKIKTYKSDSTSSSEKEEKELSEDKRRINVTKEKTTKNKRKNSKCIFAGKKKKLGLQKIPYDSDVKLTPSCEMEEENNEEEFLNGIYKILNDLESKERTSSDEEGEGNSIQVKRNYSGNSEVHLFPNNGSKENWTSIIEDKKMAVGSESENELSSQIFHEKKSPSGSPKKEIKTNSYADKLKADVFDHITNKREKEEEKKRRIEVLNKYNEESKLSMDRRTDNKEENYVEKAPMKAKVKKCRKKLIKNNERDQTLSEEEKSLKKGEDSEASRELVSPIQRQNNQKSHDGYQLHGIFASKDLFKNDENSSEKDKAIYLEKNNNRETTDEEKQNIFITSDEESDRFLKFSKQRRAQRSDESESSVKDDKIEDNLIKTMYKEPKEVKRTPVKNGGWYEEYKNIAKDESNYSSDDSVGGRLVIALESDIDSEKESEKLKSKKRKNQEILTQEIKAKKVISGPSESEKITARLTTAQQNIFKQNNFAGFKLKEAGEEKQRHKHGNGDKMKLKKRKFDTKKLKKKTSITKSIIKTSPSKEKKTKTSHHKEKTVHKGFENENYIPINVSGPTKFSVATLENLKPLNDHAAASFKSSMFWGNRVRRFTSSMTYQMYRLKQEVGNKTIGRNSHLSQDDQNDKK